MLLWLTIALLLVVTLAALLLPLFRGRDTIETRDVFDANVFKDQLKTIDREVEEGQMEREDAEAARLEISRNLLAAADKAEQNPALKAQDRHVSRLAAMALVLLVPLLAVGLYLKVGSPAIPDMPLEARAKQAPSLNAKLAELIARAEQRLAANPKDGRGWAIMAPVYMRHEMYGKAQNAYRNAIRLLGASADRLSGLADSMILANDGIVGDDALPVLKRAIKVDPDHPKPHFWMGLYYEQNNKFKQAEEFYTNLLKNSGSEVDWRPTVQQRLDEVRKKQGLPALVIAGAKMVQPPEIKLGDALKAQDKAAANAAPGPTAEQIREAGQMSAADRKQMIDNMVARLSTRLYEQGGDLKSWMRLVSVLNVQGRKGEALKAVEAGKKNLADNAQAVTQLEGLAKQLGLRS